MRKQQKSQKKEINIPIMILSIILAIFALLCIIIIFANKSYNLILGTVGVILLILTINISNLVKITKDNEKNNTYSFNNIKFNSHSSII